MTTRQLGGTCAGRQPGALAGCGLHQLCEASGGAASRTAVAAAPAAYGVPARPGLWSYRALALVLIE